MKKYLLVLMIFGNLNLFSQAMLKLTLEDCIIFAQRKSPNSSIAKNNLQSRQLHYDSFRASLYPKLSLTGSLPGLDRGITEVKGIDGSQFYSQSQLYSSSSLKLTQPIPWTGAEISISSSVNRIDVLENDKYSIWRTYPFQFRIDQPIFRVNNYSWDIEIESLNANSSESKYIEEMEDLSMNVITRFFDTYQAKMYFKNSELNVSTNDTLYTLSLGRFNVGKIAENDLLQSELALMKVRNELESAKLDYEKSLEDLKLLLGLERNIYIELIPPDDFPKMKVDEQKAVLEARENRSIISDLKIQKIESERNVTYAKLSNGFNANLSLSFGYNQRSEVLSDAYKNLLDQQSLNLNFEMPIFQWGKGSAAIESALSSQRSMELNYEQQIQKLEIDVKYLARRFDYLQKQVVLSAKADTIAQRRFEVSKSRYIIGKIDLNSFFIAQNEKDTAFQSYIQTLKSYWVAYYQLRRSTLYDFEKNKKIQYL